MHPGKSLESLGRLKSELRVRIAVRRTEFAAAAQRVARPVARIDRWRARLRSWLWLWPLAAAVLFRGRRKTRGPDPAPGQVGAPGHNGTRLLAGILKTLLDNASS